MCSVIVENRKSMTGKRRDWSYYAIYPLVSSCRYSKTFENFYMYMYVQTMKATVSLDCITS